MNSISREPLIRIARDLLYAGTIPAWPQNEKALVAAERYEKKMEGMHLFFAIGLLYFRAKQVSACDLLCN